MKDLEYKIEAFRDAGEDDNDNNSCYLISNYMGINYPGPLSLGDTMPQGEFVQGLRQVQCQDLVLGLSDSKRLCS